MATTSKEKLGYGSSEHGSAELGYPATAVQVQEATLEAQGFRVPQTGFIGKVRR